jgi:hypothetical protein
MSDAQSGKNIGSTFDKDNSEYQKKYFNNYYKTDINFNASEVDAVIGFFLKRGFEKVSAINTASVLLQQADIDQVPVFQLLDTIAGISDVQLNNVITQILNMNRPKTSKLGYKPPQTSELFDQRNIIN